MKGKITQTTLHVFDELCRHSEQQQSSSQEPHSFTCRMLNIPSTSQKCVNLSVWCLQSVILTHELYSSTSKAKTFFQLQNQSSGTIRAQSILHFTRASLPLSTDCEKTDLDD